MAFVSGRTFGTTTLGAAPVTYGAAPVTYVAAPVSYGTVAAAPVTYAAAPQVVETIAAPAVVEVPAQRNLLAMGNVISEREITIEELAARDRYAAAETVNIGVISEPVVVEPAIVETIAPAPVTYAQPVTYTSQPLTYGTVGTVMPTTLAAMPMTTMPATYSSIV